MEAAPLDTSFYKQALIVLGAAGVVIPIFHRLRVSPVLGFMLVGVVDRPVWACLAHSSPALAIGNHHQHAGVDRADRPARRRAAAVYDWPGAVLRAALGDAAVSVWTRLPAGRALRRGAGWRRHPSRAKADQ